MRKYKTVTKTVEQKEQVLVTEVCDSCGKEFPLDPDGFDNGIKTLSVDFGYGSNHDMETWTWQVCTDCLKKWFKGFKYPPEGFMVDPQFGPLEKDRQKVFEKWKETDEWDEFMDYTDEEIEALGFYSPRQNKAYEERFPVCGNRYVFKFEDGSGGIECPKGVDERGNNRDQCFNCDLFKNEPNKELPIVDGENWLLKRRSLKKYITNWVTTRDRDSQY